MKDSFIIINKEDLLLKRIFPIHPKILESIRFDALKITLFQYFLSLGQFNLSLCVRNCKYRSELKLILYKWNKLVANAK